MNAFTRFIEEKFAPPLIRFSQMKYVRIIQRTFISFTGLLIAGSLFLLLAQLPIKEYKDILGPTTLGLLGKGAGVATTILSILAVAAASYATTDYYAEYFDEKNDVLSPLVISIASFMLLLPVEYLKTVVEGSDKPGSFAGIASDFLGAKGVFTALIVGILTTEVYRYLVKKKIVIKMPEGVPPMVSQAFAALIPTMIIVTFWWLLRFVFNLNLPQIVLDLFSPLIQAGDTPAAVITATLLNRTLWSVGIHGGTVVGAVAAPIWSNMNTVNMTLAQAGEPLQYMFSGVFYDNYVWTGLAPLAILLITSKSKRLRTLGFLALPAALFNIGEPLMFGLPIVMNPVLMIPFILSSVVVAILAIISVTLGIIPVPVHAVPWITPAPFKAFMATNGSVAAVIFTVVAWIVTFVVFYAFIKVIENQDLKEEAIRNQELSKQS